VLIRRCARVLVAIAMSGGASRGAPADHAATQVLERVRAFRRATRSAIDTACRWARSSVSAARQQPLRGRRAPAAWLHLEIGGPSPLTEDRQKTEAGL